MKNIFISFILILSGSFLMAQNLDHVKWDYQATSKANYTRVVFTADIQEGWYLYSQELPEGGPIPTSFNFETKGEPIFPVLAKEQSDYILQSYDEMFYMELKKFKHQAVFTYEIAKEIPLKTIKGYLEYMCCDGNQCLAPKIIDFNFNLK